MRTQGPVRLSEGSIAFFFFNFLSALCGLVCGLDVHDSCCQYTKAGCPVADRAVYLSDGVCRIIESGPKIQNPVESLLPSPVDSLNSLLNKICLPVGGNVLRQSRTREREI